MSEAIGVERALAAECEACGKFGPALLIYTPKQRFVMCEQCTSSMLLQVSNIMLPIISERLEQRRRKL